MSVDTNTQQLISKLVDLNAAELLAFIADNMYYDHERQAIVVDVPNIPDSQFPDDRNLDRGPLTFASWRMVLFELADAMPPWTET